MTHFFFLASMLGQIPAECLLCLIRWTMRQLRVDFLPWQWYWRSILLSLSQTEDVTFGKIFFSWLWPVVFLEQKALASKSKVMAQLDLKEGRHLRQTPGTLRWWMLAAKWTEKILRRQHLHLNGLYYSVQCSVLVFPLYWIWI